MSTVSPIPENQFTPEVGQLVHVISPEHYHHTSLHECVVLVEYVSRASNTWGGKVIHSSLIKLRVGRPISYTLDGSSYIRTLLGEQEAALYKLLATDL